MDSSAPDTPLVTVGVPVYNGERFIEQTLAALQAQRLGDIEVIVADNASTDGSREIAERFAREDPRFSVLPSDVNRGSTWNYNRLLAAARGEFFAWNAADDVVLPDHVATCVALLREHPEAVMAFSRASHIDESGAVVRGFDDAGLDFLQPSPAARLDLFFRHQAFHAAFGGLYRTQVLRDAGGFEAFFGQDLALGTRMALRAPWVQSQDATYQLRWHENQMSKLQGGDPVRQTRIFTPTHRRPVAFPQWFLNYRLCAEVMNAPLSATERVKALRAVLVGWTIPNWRALPYDVKRNAIRLVRGRYEGTYHPG
jgi:glycosyltransferase involved in cell wall biosynthesis